MRPTTVGTLHDKFLRCDHCEAQVDVPDQVTIEKILDTSHSGLNGGVSRQKRMIISRSDHVGSALPSLSPASQSHLDQEQHLEIVGLDRAIDPALRRQVAAQLQQQLDNSSDALGAACIDDSMVLPLDPRNTDEATLRQQLREQLDPDLPEELVEEILRESLACLRDPTRQPKTYSYATVDQQTIHESRSLPVAPPGDALKPRELQRAAKSCHRAMPTRSSSSSYAGWIVAAVMAVLLLAVLLK